MLVIRRDLSLFQTLLFVSMTNKSFKPEPFSWKSDMSSKMQEDSTDDLVVDDSDLDDAQARTKDVPTLTKRRSRSKSKSTDPTRTINYELTAQHLQDAPTQVVGKMFLSDAQKLLGNRQGAEAATFRTLREMKDEEPIANDIEGTAAYIDRLRVQGGRDDGGAPLLDDADDLDQSLQLTLEPIRMGLNLLDQPERLQRLYESVRRTWVTSLPEGLPDATLEAKERLARSVATGVTLASYTLRPEPLPEEDHGQVRSQNQNWDLPVRSQTSQMTPSRSFDGRSQRSTLPTPSTSRSPSTVTVSSHPSTFAAPEYARLSRYTTFSKPAPPTLPRSLRRVVTHWTPGRHPANYDWLSISRNVSRREDDEEGEEMTEKERKRLQRRTERYVERQRREAEESQRQQALSSQAPTIITASQPQLAAKGASQSTAAAAGSSQPFGQSQGAATQVLPGRHGGRPPKKKRKSGF